MDKRTKNTEALLNRIRGKENELHLLFGIIAACHAVENNIELDIFQIANRIDKIAGSTQVKTMYKIIGE
jgi:hypothetical protein